MVKINRQQVYDKCGGHCGYCGKDIKPKEMQVDHMNPRVLHDANFVLFDGVLVNKTHDIVNLMPACRRCNHYKRAMTVEEFRKRMVTLHERLVNNYINKVAIDYGIITIQPFDGIFWFEKSTEPCVIPQETWNSLMKNIGVTGYIPKK